MEVIKVSVKRVENLETCRYRTYISINVTITLRKQSKTNSKNSRRQETLSSGWEIPQKSLSKRNNKTTKTKRFDHCHKDKKNPDILKTQSTVY